MAEYRRALLAPLGQAAFGSRVSCPKLVSLRKHVQQGENKVAETTAALAFGALSLGVGIEDVCKPFRLMDSILRAQVSTQTHYTVNDLHAIETELESELNPLQLKYIMGDRSTGIKMKMLEKFEHYRDILDQLIVQLRKDLYGNKR